MFARAVRLAALSCGLLALSGCGRSREPSVVAPPVPAVPEPVIATQAAPSEPAAPGPTAPAVRVLPAAATLEPGEPGVQLRAEAVGDHGGTIDLTAAVTWTAEPPGILSIEPTGYARPLGPGRATVRAVPAEGFAPAEMVVTVQSGDGRAWDFAEDVEPILTKQGCNAGGCHGRAGGQNGFHLSLFGYDPEGDHRALTREAGGRRVAPWDPERSLALQKATGRVPHGGGLRLAAGSEDYRVVRDWIAAGAPMRRGPNHGALVGLSVEPAATLLDAPGPQQLRVVARYEDGHERDVTRAAVFRVHDETTAAIDDTGRAALRRRAETDLIVRYRNRVVSARLATLINPGLDFDFAALPRRNVIDEELFKRLEALRVPPSPPADDAAFLRRVTLDLIGQVPRTDQIRAFLADTDPAKRARLVDRLLEHPDFIKFWLLKLGDLFQVTPARFAGGSSVYFETWLREQLAANTPWDEVARTLLTATGDPSRKADAPANYALDGPDPKAAAEQTAQRLMGLRLRCAQCHDHPFDAWTQDDYFGLAAIFARVARGGPDPPGMMMRAVVRINPAGTVEHPRTKQPAAMRLLDGTPVAVEGDADPRRVLADWMTAPDNPYFARAAANWAWAQFFGRGLAEPADDLSRANPPVHPELLDALARHFVEHKYNLRDLLRTIATSEAYGLSSAAVPGNAGDTRLFSHHSPRPLTAQQIADALAQVTDVVNRYGSGAIPMPLGTRALDLTDPSAPSTILDTFGRCPRTIACAPVPAPSLSLRQALLVISGDVIESKVAHPKGYLANLLDLDPEPSEVVENLYLRSLCRPPSAEELSHWTAELTAAASPREAAEDLFWALLNSKEFAFNH